MRLLTPLLSPPPCPEEVFLGPVYEGAKLAGRVVLRGETSGSGRSWTKVMVGEGRGQAVHGETMCPGVAPALTTGSFPLH